MSLFLLWMCTLQGVLEPVLPVLLSFPIGGTCILQDVGVGYILPFLEGSISPGGGGSVWL